MTAVVRFVTLLAMVASHAAPEMALAQGRQDPDYVTRRSHCRHEAGAGTALATRRTDSGISTRGYTAEQVLTWSADASGLLDGDLLICTEYGRVEVAESDDNEVRLQVRIDGYGEGSAQPEQAARQVIEETTLHTSFTLSGGRLIVKFWHSTLGFTTPGGQPAFLNVRLLVPSRGAYSVRTEAFHGTVAIRRLTLSAATLRGNVGDKLKGISGFVGHTELDNVLLAGPVDIDNLIGLPGIRAPVAPAISGLAAPIIVKARVLSTSSLTAVTGGNINIAIQPAPNLGVRATGESNDGRVTVGLDGGAVTDSAATATFRVRRSAVTAGFEGKPVQITIRASSGPGSVNIASVPSAPLPRR